MASPSTFSSQRNSASAAAVALEPRPPGFELLLGERVVEAEQPLGVLDGSELGRHGATDVLGRRVGGAQLGELVLERLELLHQRVELAVGDGRLVEHVVAPAVVLDRLGQQGVLLARLWRRCRSASTVRAGVHSLRHGSILPCSTDRFRAARWHKASAVWAQPATRRPTHTSV